MKEQMLHAFAEAHDKLLLAATTAATRGAAFSATWEPREVLAHIAAWEAEALLRIPLLATGTPDKAYNTDAFNAAAIESIGNQSFEQVETAFRQTHQRLIDLLVAQAEHAFVARGYVQKWTTALIHHSLEHAQELEALA